MKTITLNEALKAAPVQDTLKNFVGVDNSGAAGLMTPERLAAVVGGILEGLYVRGEAPLDDSIPEQGIYYNKNDNIYPYMFGLLLVFRHSTLTYEIFVSCAEHKIWTRRHNGTSWNTWA